MHKLRSWIWVAAIAATACITPVEYSDPLGDFGGGSPSGAGPRLGLVLTENVHTSLAHLNGVLRTARRVPGNAALIAEIDPADFNEDLNRMLVARFGQVVPLDALSTARTTRVDLCAVLDVQIEIGTYSGKTTTVKLALRFLDPAGTPIAAVTGRGTGIVPSPALHVGFGDAKRSAIGALGRQIDASGPIAAILRGETIVAEVPPTTYAPTPRTGMTSGTAPTLARGDFGRYHALVIGNDTYSGLPRLQTAIRDARAIAMLLRESYGFEVQLLTDVDRAVMFASIEAAGNRMTSADNLLIYYAGHGWFDERAERGYWLPVDSARDTKANWISNSLITDTLRGTEAKHVMIIADSCYSGSLTRGIKSTAPGPNYLERMVKRRARVVLTSGGLEPVVDGGANGHSVFAGALLRVLRETTTVIDGSTLFSSLRRRVMLASDQTPEYGDIRMAGHDGGDFLFVPRDSVPAGRGSVDSAPGAPTPAPAGIR